MSKQQKALDYARTVREFTCDEVAAAIGVFRHEAQGAVANLVRSKVLLCLRTRTWTMPALYAINPNPPSAKSIANRKSQIEKATAPARKLSVREQAWRELRASMDIKMPLEPSAVGQKFRGELAA